MSILLTADSYYDLSWDTPSATRIDSVTGSIITNDVEKERSTLTDAESSEATVLYSAYGGKQELPLGVGDPGMSYARGFTEESTDYNDGDQTYTSVLLRKEWVFAEGAILFRVGEAFQNLKASMTVIGDYGTLPEDSGLGIEDLGYPEDFTQRDVSLGAYLGGILQFKQGEELDKDYASWDKDDDGNITYEPKTITTLKRVPRLPARFPTNESKMEYRGDDNTLPAEFGLPNSWWLSDRQHDFETKMLPTPEVKLVKLPTMPNHVIAAWQALVKTLNIGATKGHAAASAHDIYALATVASKIRITLSAYKRNTDPIEFTYNLREDVKSRSPYKIQSSELATRNTYVQTTGASGSTVLEPWDESISKGLMQRFGSGKYLAKCKVTAKWFFNNNIAVGSVVEIADLRGTLISRQDTPCQFKVLSILKNGEASLISFTLNLLEV